MVLEQGRAKLRHAETRRPQGGLADEVGGELHSAEPSGREVHKKAQFFW